MMVPPANYPKGHVFNLMKNFPELFNEIDFADFCNTLTQADRFSDFVAAESFIDAAPFQNNYATSLVMLLSAIERSISEPHVSLESKLKSVAFRELLISAPTTKAAYQLLNDEINHYYENHGSRRAIISLITKNLTNEEKLPLIWSIKLDYTYVKSKMIDGTLLLSPKQKAHPALAHDDTAAINEELRKRLNAVIYDIRNAFVHRATYRPFPDAKTLKEHTLHRYDRYKDGLPSESWIITLPFEKLHSIALTALQRYWLREYNSIKPISEAEAEGSTQET